MGAEQRFDPTGFDGIVQMKHFMLMPDGKQYIGAAGKVTFVTDMEMVGFEVKGGETANWLLRVDGPGGSLNILGCQVRAVHQYDNGVPDALDSSYYRVP